MALTHGLSKSREYIVWCNMKARCNNPNDDYFYLYGGRGIRVCSRWLGPDGFSHFIEDMGHRPSWRHSLGRLDSLGPYCRSNCKWETWSEQATSHPKNIFWLWELHSEAIG